MYCASGYVLHAIAQAFIPAIEHVRPRVQHGDDALVSEDETLDKVLHVNRIVRRFSHVHTCTQIRWDIVEQFYHFGAAAMYSHAHRYPLRSMRGLDEAPYRDDPRLIFFNEHQDDDLSIDDEVVVLPASIVFWFFRRMNVFVNETAHFMRQVADAKGSHYLVEGITDVINPVDSLIVKVNNVASIVSRDLLRLQPDDVGNLTIAIPLSSTMNFYIRGVLVVDDALITMLKGTPLHQLVVNRVGCLAVSGYEIICS